MTRVLKELGWSTNSMEERYFEVRTDLGIEGWVVWIHFGPPARNVSNFLLTDRCLEEPSFGRRCFLLVY